MAEGSSKSLTTGESIIWNSVGSFVYLLSNWLITVLVATLSSDFTASGALAVAMAVGNLVATITLFNVRPFQVTDVESKFSTAEYAGFRLVTALIALLFGAVYMLLTVPQENFAVVFAYIFFKLGDSTVDVLHGVDQRNNRLDVAGKSQIFRGIAILVVFIVGLTLFNSLLIAVIGMALVTFIVVAAYDVRETGKLESIAPALSVKSCVSMGKSCFPGFLAALLCVFVVSYSRQAFGNICGSELLGIYAAIATPAVVIQAFAGYVYSPLLGPIAEMWHASNKQGILKLIGRFFIYVVAAEVVCTLLFLVVGTDALSLIFGERVRDYAMAMLPVLFCTGMTATMVFFNDLLISFRLNTAVVVANVVPCCVCLLSVGALVAQYGMNGVSYCIILSFAVGVVLGAFAIARGMGKWAR